MEIVSFFCRWVYIILFFFTKYINKFVFRMPESILSQALYHFLLIIIIIIIILLLLLLVVVVVVVVVVGKNYVKQDLAPV